MKNNKMSEVIIYGHFYLEDSPSKNILTFIFCHVHPNFNFREIYHLTVSYETVTCHRIVRACLFRGMIEKVVYFPEVRCYFFLWQTGCHSSL